MFNVSVNDKKNIYRSKPVMNVDTVPKPLTYDYMPEGYPSKSVETVTLMEEQELAFSEEHGLMGTKSPVVLDIKLGDKLTVVWDGVSYDVIVKKVTFGPNELIAFGNPSLLNLEEATDYPFFCGQRSDIGAWYAADTAASHTIKVMRPTVKYTPIDANYMPEGYPKKNVKIDTFEEQEITFSANRDLMAAQVSIDFEIKQGDKLTVVWDGVSYDMVAKKATAGPNIAPGFGNLGLLGYGDTTEHPFVCVYLNGIYKWATADTSPSHTIKVMRQQETITPMSTDFIPKNFNVVFSGINTTTPDSCNVTYDELRGWVENGVPVFAIYKIEDNDGSVGNVINIMQFLPNIDSLSVYYQTRGNTDYFRYNSNGTFSGSGVES